MGLNTRTKRRESVHTGAEFSIPRCGDACVTLNLPKESRVAEGAAVKSDLLDVSTIGCALDSPYMLPSGIDLVVRIDAKPFTAELGLPGRAAIEAGGKVKSCVMRSAGHYRLGIQFTKIDKESVGLIAEFIAAKDRRKAPRWDMRQ